MLASSTRIDQLTRSMLAYAISMMYVKTFCKDLANISPYARFLSYVSAGWTPIVDLTIAGFPGMTRDAPNVKSVVPILVL